MRFKCELQLSYYKNPSYKPTKGKAHISLAKKIPQKTGFLNEASTVHYLIVSSGTGSKLRDTRYKLDENVLEVTKKFSNHGMTTLKFLDPPHSLSISNGNPEDIRKLVCILERMQRDESSSSEDFEPLSSMRPITLKDIQPNPTLIDISSKTKYPLTLLPQSLKKFKATHVGLVKFDERLSRLNNLRELDLSNNKLKELPSCINQMKLTSLVLTHNHLERLPEEFGIGQLAEHLCNLDLSCNNISTLHMEFYGFHELRSLDLSTNNLTELHPNLQLFEKLLSLKLHSNLLISLPFSVYKLKMLNHLDITNNPFTGTGVKSNHGNVSLPSLFELAFRKLKSQPNKIELFRNMIPFRLIAKLDAGVKCICKKYFYDTFLTFFSRPRNFDLKCSTILFTPSTQVSLEIPLCTANCIRHVEQYKLT